MSWILVKTKKEKNMDKNICKLNEAKVRADNMSEGICQDLCDLLGECVEIVEALFLTKKLKITTEQAETFIFRVGAKGDYPELYFLREVENLKKCSKAQLQNWIDLGEAAEVKFFS